MAAARGHFNLTARTLPETHQHSAWHSPVPYLFGGLAAMLGLVAFALLILACSYWKLSGHFDARYDGDDSSRDQRDLEAGVGKEEGADRDDGGEKKEKVLEEKIVVIANTMFLATPILSPSSSNCSTSSSSSCSTRLSCFKESECGSDGDKRENLAVGEAEIASKHGETDQADRSRESENQDGSDQRS